MAFNQNRFGPQAHKWPINIGENKWHVYMRRSFILGEGYHLFKWAIKFYLDKNCPQRHKWPNNLGENKCHAYIQRSFILGEEEGLFKWAIKFYLDRIDGEKVLLAQFYFGGIIVLAQFYFYYKRRRTIELIQFYNTLVISSLSSVLFTPSFIITLCYGFGQSQTLNFFD
jgi:hypothetical protein